MDSKHRLTAAMIALINVAAICNIKNFPLMAEYGLATLFFLVLSSLFFFVPVALVSAELASAWPERGVYTWVSEGLGPRVGFLAIWLQWIENVIWYPTILSFIASTLAYIFMPSLATNKIFVLVVILVTFWTASWANSCGMKVSSWISSISALFGTIFPIALIIILGIVWFALGHPTQIRFTWSALFPDLSSLNQLVLLSGFFLGLAGMEMSAVHAKDVENPQKDYPRAIFLSALLIILLSAFGSVVIAAVVPFNEIELTAGSMEAFTYLFDSFGLSWAIPVTAAVMTLGALGMLSTWIVGPSRGLLATARLGNLPPFFQKRNAQGMPVGIFLFQAIIVTLLSLVFLYMPSVSTSYWILVALAAELYMIMYVLLFLAALRLRLTQPHVPRAYRVPCLWLVAPIGLLGTLFTIVIGLFPPSQFDTGSVFAYELMLLGGIAFFCLLPLWIYSMRKPSWKIHSD